MDGCVPEIQRIQARKELWIPAPQQAVDKDYSTHLQNRPQSRTGMAQKTTTHALQLLRRHHDHHPNTDSLYLH